MVTDRGHPKIAPDPSIRASDVASSTAQMGRFRGRGPELNRVTLRTGVIVSTPESTNVVETGVRRLDRFVRL
jgi:hypothetical protein